MLIVLAGPEIGLQVVEQLGFRSEEPKGIEVAAAERLGSYEQKTLNFTELMHGVDVWLRDNWVPENGVSGLEGYSAPAYHAQAGDGELDDLAEEGTGDDEGSEEPAADDGGAFDADA